MFLLFINDIHENLDSTLRLFADDAILYRSIKTMNDSDILQNAYVPTLPDYPRVSWIRNKSPGLPYGSLNPPDKNDSEPF